MPTSLNHQFKCKRHDEFKKKSKGKGNVPYRYIQDIKVTPAQTRMLWEFFRDNLRDDAVMLYDENEYSESISRRERTILRHHRMFIQFTKLMLNYAMLYYNYNTKVRHVGVRHTEFIDVIRLLTYKDMAHVMKGYSIKCYIPNSDQYTVRSNKTKIRILDHADGDGKLLDFIREFRQTLNKHQINIFYLGKNRINKRNHVEVRYKKKIKNKTEKQILTPLKTTEYNDIYYNVMKYNNFIKSQNITIKKQFRIKNPINIRNNSFKRLFSVFNTNANNFKVGGRYYGHWCQALKSEHRKHIKINGKEIAELDYKSLHPTILYNREGIDYQDDIYTLEKLIVKNEDNKHIKIDHNDKFTRHQIKISLNIMLNAHNFKSATNAASYQLDIPKGDASTLLKSIISKHRRIAKHFCSSAWKKNQNIESSIATYIINYFTAMRKVTLCIHDSFIVAKEDKELLEIIMVEAYQKVMGCEFMPIVEAK